MSWLAVREVGSMTGLRLVVFVLRRLGRPAARALLVPVVLYYATVSRTARAASRAYLQRMGLPARFWQRFLHLLCFGHCAVDRFLFMGGQTQGLQIERHGHEHIAQLRDSSRGAILLGAHLGSFAALHQDSIGRDYPIYVAGNFRNAPRFNHMLERMNPGQPMRLVDLSRGLDAVLGLKPLVDAGALVGILGDRHGPSERQAEVVFLGGRAVFPTGVYFLASILKCPVYLAFGLYRGGNRYDCFCEPFSELVVLPRGRRDEAAAAYAQAFCKRLEHYCAMEPRNWFNFFPVWEAA